MTTQLITRAEAGLRAPRSTPGRINARMLTAHWGGPSPWGAGGIGSHDRCASIWRAWQSFHMGSRGWSDIAYSSGVCPHGVRFEGRGPGARTAANGTDAGNLASLATCYIAGEGDPLTDPAKLGFLDEADRFGVPLIRSHRDWKSTTCAGDELTRWVHAGCPLPAGVVIAAPPPLPIIPPPITPTLEADMFPMTLVYTAEDRPTLITDYGRSTRALGPGDDQEAVDLNLVASTRPKWIRQDSYDRLLAAANGAN